MKNNVKTGFWPKRTQLFVTVYHALWHLLLPVVLGLLWKKGKKEPLYRQHWAERFGCVQSKLVSPIWVHSSSMGELRGASPFVKALLAQGLPVYHTTFTPAGRSEAQRQFAAAIQTGQLQVGYLPLELSWAVRRFIRAVKPRCAIMTEIDTWPVLLRTIKRCGLPLVMANAQYPRKSLERDQKWWALRSGVFQAYDLVLCKSTTHAQRFMEVGCRDVRVVGETRFDLPLPAAQLTAGQALVLAENLHITQRPVLAVASAVEGEDEQFLDAFQRLRKALAAAGRPSPLLVYVPRSPQRFDAVYDLMTAQGLRVQRRSTALDAHLKPMPGSRLDETDVLLGDSLGEMYFYLTLAQAVVVGASFVPLGSHNVIEPLALKKPVLVGPSMWGIEYPGVEAIEAGVLASLPDIAALSQRIFDLLSDPAVYALSIAGVERFYAEHAGSTQKHMAVFLPWLKEHHAD
ncbi:MAG: hypothetical protein RI959_163 [Pseudomonadota bacterium]